MEKLVKGNTSNNRKDVEIKQKTSCSQHLAEEKKKRKRKWNKETKRQSGFPTDDGKMVFRPYTWFLALPSKKFLNGPIMLIKNIFIKYVLSNDALFSELIYMNSSQ